MRRSIQIRMKLLERNQILILVSCFLLLATGCKTSYSFSGAAIPPEAKTVSILYFANNASLAPPTLSQTFSEALRDIMSRQTRLALVTKGGDLNFEGSITGYGVAPQAIQSNDQAATNRLTITINVKYTCAFDEKKNYEQSFSRFADFPSSQNISAVESDLISTINSQLAQDIFNKTLNDW